MNELRTRNEIMRAGLFGTGSVDENKGGSEMIWNAETGTIEIVPVGPKNDTMWVVVDPENDQYFGPFGSKIAAMNRVVELAVEIAELGTEDPEVEIDIETAIEDSGLRVREMIG